jgi:hypothetical protein
MSMLTLTPSWFPSRADDTAWNKVFREVVFELTAQSEGGLFKLRDLAMRLIARGSRDRLNAESSEEGQSSKIRLAARTTLAGALMLLSPSVDEGETLVSLCELFNALGDLDAGIVAPFLTTEVKHPKSTERQNEFRKSCVRASELLAHAYVGRGKVGKARKMVVERVKARAAVLLLPMSEATLRNWRTEYFAKNDQYAELDHERWRRFVEYHVNEACFPVDGTGPLDKAALEEVACKAYQALAERHLEVLLRI